MVTARMEHLRELLKDIRCTFPEARSIGDSSLKGWGGYLATRPRDSSNWSCRIIWQAATERRIFLMVANGPSTVE